MVECAVQVGGKLLVDACQSLPNMPVDVQQLGADWLVASAHKMCGPTGIGFLWGRCVALHDPHVQRLHYPQPSDLVMCSLSVQLDAGLVTMDKPLVHMLRTDGPPVGSCPHVSPQMSRSAALSQVRGAGQHDTMDGGRRDDPGRLSEPRHVC